MSDAFNPYRKWLGVSAAGRQPTHYELLGVSVDEEDREVIEATVAQRKAFVETKRGGGHDDAVAEVLYRLDEARMTLLDPELRRQYDRRAKLFDKRRRSRQVDPAVGFRDLDERPPRMGRAGSAPVGEGSDFLRSYAGIAAVLAVAFGAMLWWSFRQPWDEPPAVATAERENALFDAIDAPPGDATGPGEAGLDAVQADAVPVVADIFAQAEVDEGRETQGPPKNAAAKMVPPATPAFGGWLFFGQGGSVSKPDVQGATLRKSPGKSYYLATKDKLGPGVLTFRYRAPQRQEGLRWIMFAGTLPRPEARNWQDQIPRGYEVNLGKDRLGDLVFPNRATPARVTIGRREQTGDPRNVDAVDVPYRPAEWNRVRITIEPNAAAVAINGQDAVRLTGLESTAGHLVLFPGGLDFEFADLVFMADGEEFPLPFEPIRDGTSQAVLTTGDERPEATAAEIAGVYEVRWKQRPPHSREGVHTYVLRPDGHVLRAVDGREVRLGSLVSRDGKLRMQMRNGQVELTAVSPDRFSAVHRYREKGSELIVSDWTATRSQ